MANKRVSLQDIDSALKEIENKYNLNSPSVKESRSKNGTLEQLTKKLYQELDSLGIYDKNEDVSSKQDLLKDVIENTFKLINVHRNLIAEVNNDKIEYKNISETNLDLQKKIQKLKNEIEDKNKHISSLNTKLILTNLEVEDVGKAKAATQQQLVFLQKTIKSKSNEFEHKLGQLAYENQKLKDIIEKNSGNFTSKDEIITQTIQMYKNNEEVYKDTIRKVEENNRVLLEEILNLKHEVLIALNSNN